MRLSLLIPQVSRALVFALEFHQAFLDHNKGSDKVGYKVQDCIADCMVEHSMVCYKDVGCSKVADYNMVVDSNKADYKVEDILDCKDMADEIVLGWGNTGLHFYWVCADLANGWDY